ncbi:MAG: GldG family protein [Lachnospiraceae bacterium]|jgi:ABC-2 type transport system permease protein|nr:GldG family protein [Lachnospiraceae bacterium]
MKNKIALKGGSYSLVLTGIVLAILITVNVLASVLPSTWTQLDISSAKLYSITSNTKAVVNALEKDVTIYWVVQSDKEDDIIENLLAKYESLSEHIKVVKKNPDVYPTFAQQYTSETVLNNSLIVECGDSSRYISYEDIYLTEADMASYSYTTSFDGEGAITSAIDYVVSEDHPKLYMTEGHGEAEVSAVFAEQIEKQNIETVTFTLLNSDTIPEDADVVLIHAPTSDISKEEKDMLAEYTKNGGKLMVMAGPAEDGVLTNLYSLLGDYGVKAEEGIVAEGDRNYYAFRQPYILLPDMAEHEITNPLIEGNYYAIMPIAQGLTVTDTTGSVTQLLTTSETAYSKAAGYAIETYEKEEGDVDGPFATAVAVDCGSGGRMVWFASSNFLDDMYNAYSSGANLDLGMNALSFMIGEREAVAIRSKSLNYSYLTINESAASYLKVMMIGVFPLAFLGYGVYVIVSRRRRQNETV